MKIEEIVGNNQINEERLDEFIPQAIGAAVGAGLSYWDLSSQYDDPNPLNWPGKAWAQAGADVITGAVTAGFGGALAKGVSKLPKAGKKLIAAYKKKPKIQH